MAGGHLSSPSSSLSALVSVTPTATHLALARPDASVTVLNLPSLTNLSVHPAPSIPVTPASLLLLPTSPPRPLLSLPPHHLHHPTLSFPSLPAAPTAVAASATHLVLAAPDLHLLRLSDAKALHLTPLTPHHRSPVSALVLSADSSKAAVCSQAVILLDPHSGTLLRRFLGHSNPVSAAAFLPGDTRLVTATARDRFISVWDAANQPSVDVASSAVKRRRKTKSAVSPAVANLLAPSDGVVALAVDTQETSGASIAATLASGDIAVWANWTEKSAAGGKKNVESSFVVRNAPRGAKPAPVLATAFAKVGVLTVVYGSPLKPRVFTVRLCDVEGTEVDLPPCETDVLVKKAVQEGKGKANLVKTAAAAQASAAPAVPRKEKGDGANGIVFGINEEDREQSDDDASEDQDDDEPSIQQKLVALGISKDGQDMPMGAEFPAPARGKGVLGSRVNVIMQAVRSQDPVLLDESIERIRDMKLIKTTVERLPQSVAAGDLLDMLVDRLQRHPTKAEYLVRWIREVLLEHTGALLSQQRSKALVALIEIVNERTQALEGLSRLQGRLELVVARAEKLKRAGANLMTGDAVPRAEYEEEEVSEDEEGEEDSDDGSDDSAAGSEDGEDETGEFGSEESSEEGDSDEDMEDMAAAPAKDVDTMKMNGHHGGHSSDGNSSESEEESSDDGD